MRQETTSTDILELKQEVKELREDIQMLEDVVGRVLISPPILFTMPDGSKRPFSPSRPVSLRTLAIMLKVEEVSQERRRLSDEERRDLFKNDLEAARREAIAKGIAIEDEREAATGD